jgi:VCBS repeat-containing protein
VTITLVGANDAPRAGNDTGETGENQVLLVSVPGILANDSESDNGDTKTVVAINGQPAAVGSQITLASGALLTVQADGGYRYDPNGRFESLRAGLMVTDSFTYTMADGAGATAATLVSITINGANDSPLAAGDTASIGEEQVLVIAAPGILANDTDPDSGDTKTVMAINGQAAAMGSPLTLASGAVLTLQADGSYRYDPSGRFESLRAGQTATETISYLLADGAGATASANVTITIIGRSKPSSLSGGVYVDVNNDGIRQAAEMGLPQIFVRLEGPILRSTRTDDQGNYRFEGLPDGIYTVWEFHPQSFLDGKETPGTPRLGEVSDDRFSGLPLSDGTHAAGYNFGERGLRWPSKAMELASTPSPIELLRSIMAVDEPATLEAQFPSSRAGMIARQNPRNLLDVSDDGTVSPLDALLIINVINAGFTANGPTSAISAQSAASEPFYDTNGDHFVSPIDALLVINYLNSKSAGGDAEGESFSDADTAEALGSDDMETLLDLLATDTAGVRRKKH